MQKETKVTYLNTAAAGLLSPASASAATQFQQNMLTNPGDAFMQWVGEGLPRLRQKVGQLLHTDAVNIAFTPNFSYSLLPVIQSVAPVLKKVLLYKDDYPSLNMPFELAGFDVHYVESPDGFTIPLSGIQEICEREKIELVAISHVQFLTGFKIDLEALGAYCKEKGIALVVDATQCMGAVDYHFDTLPVDVLISSSYKWLNGGYGSAVMAVKPEFISRFAPRFAGFGSMRMTDKGWTYTPSAVSYEPGHLNVLGLLQLEHAIDQRLLDGVVAVAKHNAVLIQSLANDIAETKFNLRGGADTQARASILCIEAEQVVGEKLKQAGFAVTWRRGLIRISPHFYNTKEEIDALVLALKAS